MADDPAVDPTWAATAPPSAFQQLTQTRVPLDEAGEAFTVPDVNGRLPIVVLPKQPFRIRNEFVIAGIIAIVIGLFLDIAIAFRGALVGLGAVALFLGVFQSFLVAVPEGARALLLRSGRYHKTIGAGRHVVPPWIVVSHVVTVREIPFEAVASQVPCRDDVRVDLGLLLTFTIVAPEKFVFLISAPDFDQVCLAACLDAARVLVRSKVSAEILDLSGVDTELLRTTIEAAIAPYGVQVGRVVITRVQPPPEYMASREARRLAVVQREEQAERHALAERLLADREALKRQRAIAQRERIELQAANEELRLRHLQDRITAFPLAVRYDVDGQRLDVARSLAGNTRAMVQVGGDRDVADALVVHTLADDANAAAEAPAPASGPVPVAKRGTRAPRGGV
jgi:regulator of protease activity HflC (stomatin/prohibitin superfamily)